MQTHSNEDRAVQRQLLCDYITRKVTTWMKAGQVRISTLLPFPQHHWQQQNVHSVKWFCFPHQPTPVSAHLRTTSHTGKLTIPMLAHLCTMSHTGTLAIPVLAHLHTMSHTDTLTIPVLAHLRTTSHTGKLTNKPWQITTTHKCSRAHTQHYPLQNARGNECEIIIKVL